MPFFVYFNHSLLHMPVVRREDFKGKTGQGDWADSLLELDTDFGTLLDLLDELGIANDTLVVFAGDNGPEDTLLWRGSPGYWEGSYFAGGEGNLRTPCIARWPGQVSADAAAKLPLPRLVNLTLDPHERERVSLPHLHTWVAYHANALIAEYEASIEREPLIPMGAPLDRCPAGR